MHLLDVSSRSNAWGREAWIFPVRPRSRWRCTRLPSSKESHRLLVSAVKNGIKAGHKEGAPQPDDGDYQPRGIELRIDATILTGSCFAGGLSGSVQEQREHTERPNT